VLDEDAAPPLLSIDEVLERMRQGAVVIDTRDPSTFAQGHLRGSVNVGLQGCTEYAGNVIDAGRDIVLVGDPGTTGDARVKLSRIGFDTVIGDLDDPLKTFLERPELVEQSSRLTAQQFAARADELGDLAVLDVRNPGETVSGKVPGARNIPLASLLREIPTLDVDRPTVVYCAGGYRSSIAASTLRAHGFRDVSDIVGGYEALRLSGSAHSPAE
jgi:hydroxyacylglutathione hydrolase